MTQQKAPMERLSDFFCSKAGKTRGVYVGGLPLFCMNVWLFGGCLGFPE
jgi:hypothetical protein